MFIPIYALANLSGQSNELMYTMLAFLLSAALWGSVMAVLPWWIGKKHAPKLSPFK
jgi:hypothetical protein